MKKATSTEIRHDLLTLCLRLCLEPSTTHAPETLEVLDRWRPAWERAAAGVPFDIALESCGPSETGTTPSRDAVLEALNSAAAWLDKAVDYIDDSVMRGEIRCAEIAASLALKNALPQVPAKETSGTEAEIAAVAGEVSTQRPVDTPAAAAPVTPTPKGADVAWLLLHSVREKWSAMCGRYTRVGSDWHLKMPKDWPVEVVMTMDELRQLAAIERTDQRNAP